MRWKVSDRTPVVQGFASGKTLVRRTPGGSQSAAGSAGCLKSDYFLPRNSMIRSRNIAAYLPHSKAAGVPLVFTGPAGSESRPVQGFAFGKTLARRTPSGFQSAAGRGRSFWQSYFLPRSSIILSRSTAAYLPHSKAAGVPLVPTGPAGSESRPVQGFASGKTLVRRTSGGFESAAGAPDV